MSRKITMLAAIALVFYSLVTIASDTLKVKEFSDFQCKLSLPISGFDWLDHSKIPQAKAALGNGSGMMLILLVNKVPNAFEINESFSKGFDKAFNQPGIISKISGEIIRFRGVPCYQLHVRFEQNNSIATIRVFVANGYLYQLQVIGSSLPIEKRGELENVFSAFEFIEKSVLPVHTPPSSKQKAYNFSENMGRIAAYCIVGIIVLAIAGKIMGKKKKKDSLQTHSHGRTNRAPEMLNVKREKDMKPDFILISKDYKDFEEPRSCFPIKKLKGRGGPYLLVKIDPPIIGQAYGLGEKDIEYVVLGIKFVGTSLFPVSKWPLSVNVARLLCDIEDKTSVDAKKDLKLIAWAELYKNAEDLSEW